MRLHTLVLEGDKNAEKEKDEKHLPPVYTKSDYLRCKRIESQPPLHNRSFYLCRMAEEVRKLKHGLFPILWRVGLENYYENSTFRSLYLR